MSGARAHGRTNRQLPAGKATRLPERRLAEGRAIMRDPFPLHDKKSLWGIFCFPPVGGMVTPYFAHTSFVGQAITALNLVEERALPTGQAGCLGQEIHFLLFHTSPLSRI